MKIKTKAEKRKRESNYESRKDEMGDVMYRREVTCWNDHWLIVNK